MKTQRWIRFIEVIYLIHVFNLTSCQVDIDLENISNDNIRPFNLAIPLGRASISLGELLSNNNLTNSLEFSDGNEIVFQSFDSTYFEFREVNLLSNTKAIIKHYPLYTSENAIIPAFGFFESINSTEFVNLGINLTPTTERIDSVLIKHAVLSVVLNQSDVDIPARNISVKIKFPSSHIKMLENDASNIFVFHPKTYNEIMRFELSNFMLYTLNTASGFPVIVEINGQAGAIPVEFTRSSAIKLNLNIDQLEFAVAYGFFEPQFSESQTQQFKLDLDKHFPNGLLKFSNPQISISAESNIGTYLSFQVDYVKAFVQNDVSIEPVYAWFDGHKTKSFTVVFDTKPKLPGSWVNFQLQTFDKDFGEINHIFDNLIKPDILEYKFSTYLNQSLIQKDYSPNFITPDGVLKIKIITKIPFDFDEGSYIEFKDSIGNLVKRTSNVFDKFTSEKIDSAFLVLNIKNGFPVATKLSIKLLDSIGNELKINFDKDYYILSGNVNTDGFVESGHETKQMLCLTLLKNQLETLRKAEMIVYSVRVEGKDESSKIIFRADNKFEVKIGLFVSGTLDTFIGGAKY